MSDQRGDPHSPGIHRRPAHPAPARRRGTPAIPGAHPAPGLSASGGYAEADLARDLGLDDDQLPPDAVTAYLDAADETFWHETERIACEHLAASTTRGRSFGNRDGAGPVSAPAPQEAVLRQAEQFGRRHGKAGRVLADR